MFIGRVIGTVWSTIKWPSLEGTKLLLVRPFHYDEVTTGKVPKTADCDGVVVADTLDAGVGDTVIVAYGHAARVAVTPDLAVGDKPSHPIDAAIVAIVDGVEVDSGA
ncbi:MAG TPA: ethanolamine utilization protein EutN [Myxococcales bacterium]|nr:ethanolamine utilization protein EutN [Myxococcales bacterium]HIN85322.1 ethanolamine utilization protein EutN [Myxococcales bacterium]